MCKLCQPTKGLLEASEGLKHHFQILLKFKSKVLEDHLRAMEDVCSLLVLRKRKREVVGMRKAALPLQGWQHNACIPPSQLPRFPSERILNPYFNGSVSISLSRNVEFFFQKQGSFPSLPFKTNYRQSLSTKELNSKIRTAFKSKTLRFDLEENPF